MNTENSDALDSEATPVTQKPLIIVVEDSDDDYYALQRAVRAFLDRIRLQRYISGTLASQFLMECSETDELPQIILLDLNIPGLSGRELLAQIKGSAKLRHLPVLIYSTSDSPDDIRYCYSTHANAYHTKPLDFDRMRHELTETLDYWLNIAKKPLAR